MLQIYVALFLICLLGLVLGFPKQFACIQDNHRYPFESQHHFHLIITQAEFEFTVGPLPLDDDLLGREVPHNELTLPPSFDSVKPDIVFIRR